MPNTTHTFEFNSEEINFYSHTIHECTTFIHASDFTPLMYIILNAREIENDDVLNNYIQQYKETINDQNSKGWTALMLACANCKNTSTKKAVELLLNAGANANLINNNGNNALMLTAEKGSNYVVDCVIKLLLDAKVDVNMQNETGLTAVAIAACSNREYTNSIKLLLDANSDLTIKTKNGETMFKIVCRCTTPEMARYCLDTHTYYDENILIDCCKSNSNRRIMAQYLSKHYLITKCMFCYENQ